MQPALSLSQQLIMALIYQTNAHQKSGHTLTSIHRSAFINLDVSVGNQHEHG